MESGMPARPQLRRILVPLDGSTLAEAILPVVERLARDHEAEVVLLEVLAGQRTPEVEHEAERQASGYLERAVVSLRSRGLRRVQARVWYGDADQAIVNATAREQADLVAMSTHGRSGLDRLRFGSVAESVVRRAPVPVLLARGIAAWDRGGIDRILVPLDGSAASEDVLPIVSSLAGPFDFEILLLHVVEATRSLPGSPTGGKSDRDRETEAAYLARVAKPLEARGLRVVSTVQAGLPANVIPDVVAETKSGLVAMSTHGRTGLGRIFLGSVAERVLRAVSVPVLLWKPPTDTRGPSPTR
jgi:nucleotide-binding universal stress UspA family protein